MIQKERIKALNNNPVVSGKHVIYWMQASQRTECNHALQYAVRQANEKNSPIIVYFGLTDSYPEANRRHYYFMLEGLKEVAESLAEQGIKMVIERQSPDRGIVLIAKQASMVICDRGYLKIQRQWRDYVAKNIKCALIQVETDIVVPVEEASSKQEYAAATFRPKIMKELPKYFKKLDEQKPKIDSIEYDYPSINISSIENTLSGLKIDETVTETPVFHGGTLYAKQHLRQFIDHKLATYSKCRNDPNANCLSNMSPYLHFGQISPLYIALQVLNSTTLSEGYLEELVVRRELSVNYAFYNEDYDSFSGLPEWAKNSLHKHQKDMREYVYGLEDFETANTHDPYWNAAQIEMVKTGKMHGYMRMYWGKKILEWSNAPEEAIKIALYLNNKYEIDGRDANGYTGVAWCFGKHDRPWAERPIFGNIRYMNANGLKRKFNADAYVERIKHIS
ncbi:MAG: deoxyribodipyrimidine photo-lyase [Dehalococcoidia bacterium]|nr:MAG: deoxyribodipyrimidine photo-lyase [Dehalococcoidia bacterium]